MKLKAFTLAEVLITLVIIGVVAALTIPTLVNTYQKQEYVVGFKKAYSEWNQALALMANDAGCPGDLSCFFPTTYTDDASENTMGKKISTYFKIVKECNAGQGQYGCYPDVVAGNFDGSGVTTGTENNLSYRFITADGMSVMLQPSFTEACSDNYAPGAASKMCMDGIQIDINGLKKPNIMGRDIFVFAITNGDGPALTPYGLKDYEYWQGEGCTKGTIYGANTTGYSCAGRIIDEGWKMTY